MDANYDKLLSIISKSSGLKKEEIEQKIQQKRERISGMISKEGAAQIVAAELGISFENEKLKIGDLIPGMKKVNIMGKVINIFPVRKFVRNSQEGKVANLIVADETSNVRVVLWDTAHIELIETNKISEGTVIEIFSANMRENELHLGSFCEIKISDEVIENVNKERVLKEKDISEFKVSDNLIVRAFVMQIFEPKFFNVCSECKKKVIEEQGSFVCAQHGKVTPERRVLINLVLDDGTGTIRAVLFNEQVSQIGFTPDDANLFGIQKQNLLGKEMYFSGVVRQNNFFNNTEMIVNNTKGIDIDELIQKLEHN